MNSRIVLLACLTGLALGPAAAQEVVRYKSAVVALADDPTLRTELEESLAAKFRDHNYDAITSYDIVSEVTRLDDSSFVRRLADRGVQAVLMLRPAAIGPGSTLESVRAEVSPEVFRDMRAFAEQVGSTGGDELVAVVHMAVYTIVERRVELVSAGAVWLDEAVESREQGIERLQDLIVRNLDEARPLLRQRLSLPPLP